MVMRATYERWPQALRLARGLVNGTYVQLGRESRGHNRAWLARRVGLSVVELRAREGAWTLWPPAARAQLVDALDYPPAFFVQEDSAPSARAMPIHMSGTDPLTGESWCQVVTHQVSKRPDGAVPPRVNDTHRHPERW